MCYEAVQLQRFFSRRKFKDEKKSVGKNQNDLTIKNLIGIGQLSDQRSAPSTSLLTNDLKSTEYFSLYNSK